MTTNGKDSEMLAISMKKRDRTTIELPDGTLAVVMVVEIRRDRVRVAFDFPRELNICREGVWRELAVEDKRYADLAASVDRRE